MGREVLRHESRSGEVIHRVSPGLSTSLSLQNGTKVNKTKLGTDRGGTEYQIRMKLLGRSYETRPGGR